MMQKIAIIRRNGLGDLLCTFPLINYLRSEYPLAKITLFVDERNAPLLSYLPPLDEVVVFPAKGNKYLNLFATALRYRYRRFDLAISTKTSPMKLTNFFLGVLGAKKRVAYVDNAWHRIFINHKIPFKVKESKKKHQALKVLNMIAPQFSSVPEELFPKMSLPSAMKQKYATLISNSQPTLLLSASTTRPSSRFDEQRYAALVNRLYKEMGPFNVIVLGQGQDEVRAHALSDQLKIPYLLHFPRNFEEFIVLVEGSDLCFVGDGGIAHISAAFGKRAVVLFGESNPLEWAPLGGSRVDTFYNAIHVNRLPDELIYEALKKRMQEVICGRANYDGRLGCDTGEPLPTSSSLF